jgi:hypothetical protein
MWSNNRQVPLLGHRNIGRAKEYGAVPMNLFSRLLFKYWAVILFFSILLLVLLPFNPAPIDSNLGLQSIRLGQANTVTLYVAPNGDDANPGSLNAPVASLGQAQILARQVIARQQSVLVYVRGGRYELSQPLKFDQRDSATSPIQKVTYAAYPGERPVLSGGVPIKNWQAAENGLYRAPVNFKFRQLYVNGRPAVRARFPNREQYLRLRHWYASPQSSPQNTSPNDRVLIAEAKDLANVQLAPNGETEIVIQRDWAQDRLRIATLQVSGDQAKITVREPEREVAFGSPYPFKYPKQAYHLENSLSFLDAPGEWFLDAQGNTFYKPQAGESLTNASVIAPRLETLVDIQGTPEQPIRNLEFRGLSFTDTTWLQPSLTGRVGFQGPTAYVGSNQTIRQTALTGTVRAQYVTQFNFERNRISNSGGNGLILGIGVQNSQITGNVIRDIAASGVVLGEPTTIDPQVYQQENKSYGRSLFENMSGKLPAAGQIKGNTVSNNFITRIGLDYADNLGIFGAYLADTKIVHNHLVDMPYSGIGIGWGWTEAETDQRNNLIESNDVSRTMQLLTDGGSIYHLSASPKTEITQNYIHNMRLSPWPVRRVMAGIMLDFGSHGLSVSGNVIQNIQLETAKSPNDLVIPILLNIVKKELNTVRENEGNSSTTILAAGLEPRYKDIKESGL